MTQENVEQKNVIAHKQNYRSININEDFIIICQGDHRKAAILNVLEQETNHTLADDPENDLFVSVSLEEFGYILLGLYSEKTILRTLSSMIEDGIIERRSPQRHSRTYEYRINTSLIQSLIDALPQKRKDRRPKAISKRIFSIDPEKIISPQAIRIQNTLLARFNGRCAYCQKREADTWDHIVPRIRGGETLLENLVPACWTCNSSKNDSDVFAWMLVKDIQPSQTLLETIKQCKQALDEINGSDGEA